MKDRVECKQKAVFFLRKKLNRWSISFSVFETITVNLVFTGSGLVLDFKIQSSSKKVELLKEKNKSH